MDPVMNWDPGSKVPLFVVEIDGEEELVVPATYVGKILDQLTQLREFVEDCTLHSDEFLANQARAELAALQQGRG